MAACHYSKTAHLVQMRFGALFGALNPDGGVLVIGVT